MTLRHCCMCCYKCKYHANVDEPKETWDTQRQQRCPRSGGETPGTRVSITRALILSEPARGVYHCEWEGARVLRRTVSAGAGHIPLDSLENLPYAAAGRGSRWTSYPNESMEMLGETAQVRRSIYSSL